MSAALKEFRDRYKAARARLWSVPAGQVVPIRRDILRVASFATIYDEPIGPEPPESIPYIAATPRSVARGILLAVCGKHGVSMADLCGDRRVKYIATARHEACYRLATETTWTLARIGSFVGGRDHSTVSNSIKQHKKRMEA